MKEKHLDDVRKQKTWLQQQQAELEERLKMIQKAEMGMKHDDNSMMITIYMYTISDHVAFTVRLVALNYDLACVASIQVSIICNAVILQH